MNQLNICKYKREDHQSFKHRTIGNRK